MGGCASLNIKKNYQLYQNQVDYFLDGVSHLCRARPIIEHGSLRGVEFPSRVRDRWAIWKETPLYVVDCRDTLRKRKKRSEKQITELARASTADFTETMGGHRSFDRTALFAWVCHNGQIYMYQTVKTKRIASPIGAYNTI